MDNRPGQFGRLSGTVYARRLPSLEFSYESASAGRDRSRHCHRFDLAGIGRRRGLFHRSGPRFGYIPNNRVGVVEKLWSRQRLGVGRPHHRPERRGRLPGRSAARRSALRPVALAVSRSQACRSSPSRRARSATSMPATASRCRPARRSAASSPATTSRTPRPSSVSRASEGEPSGPRPARPAARHPARRRLRHQPGPVRGHHRGRRLSPAPCQGGTRELQTLLGWQQELRRVDGFSPVVVGA